jgi:LuxR family maltose regulon positive regulatory protein
MPPAPLIATKFHLAPTRADLIPRPQLFQLLDEGLQEPLILVSAPPGFGKSMLVAGWINARRADDLRAAWLSLDEGDNDPGVFWQYFIAAVQCACPGIGVSALATLSSPNPPAMQTVLALLLNELSGLQQPLLLVLDDYHLIQSPEIHDNLKFFLDHQPSGVHLVILTREDPPLSLARRRARRQLVELRAQDLRFDLREAAEFLNGVRELALTSDQISTLEQRTEGWITGLQMAALSLQGRDPTGFFESFTGDDRYIAEYLIEEVLQRQPAPVREFLLKTSILENLSSPLCAALTGSGSARETLDYLERANLFLISLDTRRENYRYHHLFAELLRQRLRESFSPQAVAELQRAASAWYESQIDIPAAIRHARQVPDEGLALRLIEQYAGDFFRRSAIPQLFELARAIPPAQCENAPALCAAVAWATLAASHFEAVDDWLKPIEKHFGLPAEAALNDPALDPARRAALLEVLVLRLQLPYYPQTAEHALAIRDQLNALPPDQPCLFNNVASLRPVITFNLGLIAENNAETTRAASAFEESIALARDQQNWHLYHIALGHLANIQTAMGSLRAARRTYEQALAESSRANVTPYLALMHAGLGALYYEWNDLPAAEHHFDEALSLARLWNHWESLIPIALGRAHLKRRAGETLAALDILGEFNSPPIEGLNLPLEAYAAYLEALDGTRAASAVWLSAHSTAVAQTPSPATESFLLDAARVMTVLQRYDEALANFQKIINYASNTGRTHLLIPARLGKAKVLSLQGKSVEAFASLLTTLPPAAAEGYISTFVDEGETMRKLLVEARDKAPAALRAYIDQVLAAFAKAENPAPRRELLPGRPDLSEREREILALVAAGLSNQEIADRLVISITTVKTHVGNIFNKLGVTSRTQALVRAEALGLLPRQ